MTCPFCDEADFDPIGLKHHLVSGYCEMFNRVVSIEEEKKARIRATESQDTDS